MSARFIDIVVTRISFVNQKDLVAELINRLSFKHV